VLKPIRWESVRRNEVGTVISNRSSGLYIEEARQQRAGLFLRDVDYLIHAQFELTDKAGPDDNPLKFAEMFRRRAEKGQCFNQPYLGCREFSAAFVFVNLAESLPAPILKSSDLGWMLYDIDHSGSEPLPHFFRVAMDNGTIRVPPWDSSEVMG
jgi:CRISPR-associated protein Cas5d